MRLQCLFGLNRSPHTGCYGCFVSCMQECCLQAEGYPCQLVTARGVYAVRWATEGAR